MVARWSAMAAVPRDLGRRAMRARTATMAMSSTPHLFGFVKELADDHEALIAQSKQTLGTLGRDNDYVKLHLPSATAPTDATAPNARILSSLSHCAVIEVHNPSARNALSGRMMAQLADIMTELENPQVHKKLNTVVLRGSGGWFCAGADLRVAKKVLSTRDAGAAMGALMVDTLTRLRRLPLVSVAVVEGGAFGGGAELSTSCDFRILADNAVIQFVQSKMGVSPGWGGGARLHRIVGRQHALRLLCTAEKLTPARAMKLGLVDTVFANDKASSCDEACVDFLRPFDTVTPEVSHGAKRVISNADDVSLDEVLAFEHREFKTLWGGPANIKALENALRKTKQTPA